MFFTKIKSMDINEIKNKNISKQKIIDVRTRQEHNRNKIPGTKNIEMNELILNTDKYINKNDTYYIYCQSGMRAKKTTKKLTKLGFNVINIGGIMSYRR